MISCSNTPRGTPLGTLEIQRRGINQGYEALQSPKEATLERLLWMQKEFKDIS